MNQCYRDVLKTILSSPNAVKGLSELLYKGVNPEVLAIVFEKGGDGVVDYFVKYGHTISEEQLKSFLEIKKYSDLEEAATLLMSKIETNWHYEIYQKSTRKLTKEWASKLKNKSSVAAKLILNNDPKAKKVSLADIKDIENFKIDIVGDIKTITEEYYNSMMKTLDKAEYFDTIPSYPVRPEDQMYTLKYINGMSPTHKMDTEIEALISMAENNEIVSMRKILYKEKGYVNYVINMGDKGAKLVQIRPRNIRVWKTGVKELDNLKLYSDDLIEASETWVGKEIALGYNEDWGYVVVEGVNDQRIMYPGDLDLLATYGHSHPRISESTDMYPSTGDIVSTIVRGKTSSLLFGAGDIYQFDITEEMLDIAYPIILSKRYKTKSNLDELYEKLRKTIKGKKARQSN